MVPLGILNHIPLHHTTLQTPAGTSPPWPLCHSAWSFRHLALDPDLHCLSHSSMPLLVIVIFLFLNIDGKIVCGSVFRTVAGFLGIFQVVGVHFVGLIRGRSGLENPGDAGTTFCSMLQVFPSLHLSSPAVEENGLGTMCRRVASCILAQYQ